MAVKVLMICLIILTISGCTTKEYIKCKTPDVPKPIILRAKHNNILDSSKQCLINYSIIRAYADKLNEANKVCK